MDAPFPRQMGSKSNHALSLQRHLHDQMMSQSEFCDVTLIVDNVEIKAHWCVLVSCPYFQSLYDSGLVERFSGTIELNIAKSAAVRSALDFLYLGNLEISYESVPELLKVADYFQITELKKVCQDYLYSVNITTDNCVQICLLCSLYDLDLYTRAFDFLRGNLPEIMQKEDILSLTHDSVMSLLSDPSLCYVSQIDFFNFIVRWVQFEEKSRIVHFEELFCALNIHRIPVKILDEEVAKHKFVNDSEKCLDSVLSLKSKYSAGLIQEDSGTRDVIIVTGGSGDGVYFRTLFHAFPFSECVPASAVYGFIISEERWIELAPMPDQMEKHLMTYNPQGYLYVYNTEKAQFNLNNNLHIYKYKIEDRTWTRDTLLLPGGIKNVKVLSLVCCNSHLYAVISCIMKFPSKRPPEEQWDYTTVLVEVKEGRESVIKCYLFRGDYSKAQISSQIVNNSHICILAWNHATGKEKIRKIKSPSPKFIMYDTVKEKKLDQSKGAYWDNLTFRVENDIFTCRFGKQTAKKFCFQEKHWTTLKEQVLSPLPEDPTRQEFAQYSDGANLYVFGGRDPSTKKLLDTAFKFNFDTRQWTKLENMPQALMNSAACQVTMPLDEVRCHINCPHCLCDFKGRKHQAVYDIQNHDADDDSDCDYSYDDDDLNSDMNYDEWGDYLDYYDPYEDWW